MLEGVFMCFHCMPMYSFCILLYPFVIILYYPFVSFFVSLLWPPSSNMFKRGFLGIHFYFYKM